MIKFVWQHKYKLLFFVIICFVFSIFKLKNPTIFYDSERILQFADDVELEQEESINSSNLFLVGVEYDKSIQFNDLIKLQSIHYKLLEDKNIALTQSVFNDISLINLNFFLPVIGNKKIKNKESLFISEDQRKLFYIIELKSDLGEDFNKEFISNLEDEFNKVGASSIYITGQVKAELYIKDKIRYIINSLDIFYLHKKCQKVLLKQAL